MAESMSKFVGRAAAVADGTAPVVDHRSVVGRNRRANTRARIVEAAITVYAEKGPDVPVIDDFVKAAGMSRGTFYNYFTTTSDLLAATVDLFESRMIKTIVAVTEQYADPAAQAAIAMRLYLHWITTDLALCSFFARIPQIAEVGRRDARARLRQGVRSGVFQIEDFDATCHLVFGTLSETIRRAALAPESPRRCDEVVRLLMLCLGVPRPQVSAIMALPLPEISVPVRLSELYGTPKAGDR